MKNRIQIAGSLYVSFAVILAYCSVDAFETSPTNSGNRTSQVESLAGTLQHTERLDYTDTKTNPDEQAKYTVVAWTAGWCGPCKRWKQRQLPTLLNLGYKVEVKDIDAEQAPREVKSIPTVFVYYNGRMVKFQVAWTAIDIDKFIKGRMYLKQR